MPRTPSTAASTLLHYSTMCHFLIQRCLCECLFWHPCELRPVLNNNNYYGVVKAKLTLLHRENSNIRSPSITNVSTSKLCLSLDEVEDALRPQQDLVEKG